MANHVDECRKRCETEMLGDSDDKDRVERAKARAQGRNKTMDGEGDQGGAGKDPMEDVIDEPDVDVDEIAVTLTDGLVLDDVTGNGDGSPIELDGANVDKPDARKTENS